MRKSVITAAIILFLAACAPGQSPQGAQGQIETAVALTVAAHNDIGTAVALTVAAQNPTASPTVTFTPTSASSPTLTPAISTVTPIAATQSSGGGGGGGVPPKPDYACDLIHARPFDNEEFPAGQEFDIKWTILNTGTKTWPQGYDVKYLSGPNMTTTGITLIELPEMRPRAQFDIVFDAKAPMDPGFHVMTWVVEGQLCYPYVAINVK